VSKKNVASAADAYEAIGGDPRPRSTETSARVARRRDWSRSEAEPPSRCWPGPAPRSVDRAGPIEPGTATRPTPIAAS